MLMLGENIKLRGKNYNLEYRRNMYIIYSKVSILIDILYIHILWLGR